MLSGNVRKSMPETAEFPGVVQSAKHSIVSPTNDHMPSTEKLRASLVAEKAPAHLRFRTPWANEDLPGRSQPRRPYYSPTHAIQLDELSSDRRRYDLNRSEDARANGRN